MLPFSIPSEATGFQGLGTGLLPALPVQALDFGQEPADAGCLAIIALLVPKVTFPRLILQGLVHAAFLLAVGWVVL